MFSNLFWFASPLLRNTDIWRKPLDGQIGRKIKECINWWLSWYQLAAHWLRTTVLHNEKSTEMSSCLLFVIYWIESKVFWCYYDGSNILCTVSMLRLIYTTITLILLNSLTPGKDLIFGGISYEKNSTLLCWSFTSNQGAKHVLIPCTTAKMACFRQGIHASSLLL